MISFSFMFSAPVTRYNVVLNGAGLHAYECALEKGLVEVKEEESTQDIFSFAQKIIALYIISQQEPFSKREAENHCGNSNI